MRAGPCCSAKLILDSLPFAGQYGPHGGRHTVGIAPLGVCLSILIGQRRVRDDAGAADDNNNP